MAAKRGVIGLKGLALAKVLEDTILSYKCAKATVALQYASAMNKTPKETSFEDYADDDLYAEVIDKKGEELEIRLKEVPLSVVAEAGLGEYDPATNTLEDNFNVKGTQYSLRGITDTISGLPYYIKYRSFTVTSIDWDNYQTKGSNLTVCEVIIKGIAKRPALRSVKARARMELLEDESNLEACEAFLSGAEEYPLAG